MNKTSIKKIVLVCLIACFALNTTAVAAMIACHKSTMVQTYVSSTDVPCHGADKMDLNPMSIKTEIDTQATVIKDQRIQDHTTQDHSAECQSFSCGHCPLLTQALPPNTLGWFPSNHTNYPPYDDINVSAIADGIDYPPKHLS